MTRLKPGELIIRLSYVQRNAAEPLISVVTKLFDVSLNIIFADINIVQDAPHRRHRGHHQRRALAHHEGHRVFH